MELYFTTGNILFLYLVFVAAGTMLTGMGIVKVEDGDDGWEWRLVPGLLMLIVAVLAFTIGVRTGFVHVILIW